MIFFRVSQNINIKTTDGTLVNYFRFKGPSNLENETVYITTYNDFNDLKEVFAKVDKDKYFARLLKEKNIKALENFPIQLGIQNNDEYLLQEELDHKLENKFTNTQREIKSFLFNSDKVDIYKQIKNLSKDEISIVVIGSFGKSISETILFCTALRILHKKLDEIYKSVKLDLYIDASNNSFYSRDKQIYLSQNFINKVLPLSINSKKICQYDYYIDNSSVKENSAYFENLNFVDACLFKFGIDYEKIDSNEKYNSFDILDYEVKESLKNKIQNAKLKGKLLLFHPYSANINKSIPQTIAIEMLKKLLTLNEEYIIVSTLSIDSKINDDKFLDLSKESKTISDFIYIVSNMDKIITTDTSTYHISDAFMIPTVIIFTSENFEKKIKYYKYGKAIYVKDESKNLSKFIFENDNLTFYKFESWKKLKLNKIIKLLDSF